MQEKSLIIQLNYNFDYKENLPKKKRKRAHSIIDHKLHVLIVEH